MKNAHRRGSYRGGDRSAAHELECTRLLALTRMGVRRVRGGEVQSSPPRGGAPRSASLRPWRTAGFIAHTEPSPISWTPLLRENRSPVCLNGGALGESCGPVGGRRGSSWIERALVIKKTEIER
jgi:hypothetical protein